MQSRRRQVIMVNLKKEIKSLSRKINFKKDILPKLKSMAAKAIAAGSQGFN
jgi:hypothetical protein